MHLPVITSPPITMYLKKIKLHHHCSLLASIALSFFVLLVFKAIPIFGFILAQYILLAYIHFTLKYKVSYIIFIFPLLIYFLSIFFSSSYNELGDGVAYFNQTMPLLDKFRNNGIISTLVDDWELGLPYFYFQYHAAGVFFVHWLPSLIIDENISDIIYFFSQTYFHLILTAILLFYNRIWRVVPKKYETVFFLFLILSPSFFEIQAAPTRHIFTFFLVALFYFASVAFYNEMSLHKFVVLIFCIIAMLLNKPPYLVTFGLFLIYLYGGASKKGFRRALILSAVVILFIYFTPLILKLFARYSDYATASTRSISFDSAKFIWPIFKLTAALAAPLPWYKIEFIANDIYGGNIFIVFMHILSSLFGFWVFGRIFLHFRHIWNIDASLCLMTVYGLIMSSSILFGATAYHSYIAIFFPFFSPLLVIRKYNLPISVVVVFLLFLNILLFSLKLS